MTHADLVKRAERWLRSSATVPNGGGKSRRVKCGVVSAELVTLLGETPDAVGWAYGGRISIMVECKTSRADYLRDQKKLSRRTKIRCIGKYRYYMTPAGLLKPEELAAGWGLLEVEGRRVSLVKMPEEQAHRCLMSEMIILWSIGRRAQEGLGWRGINRGEAAE